MAAVKTSPPRSTASPASSPEATAPEQIAQPPQKRKGGRKPVYATQEERKMRNRAAQAAFRERRTEYIKHLEATIKHHEEQLSGLQQSSRNAADEVLMLRYKNSLLERILMEKGIDVTAELRAVSQYDDRPQPAVSQTPAPPQSQSMPPQPHIPPMQQMHRPVVGRPQAPLPPKRTITNPIQDVVFIKASPDLRPVPTSRNSSPSVVATMPTPPGQPPYPLPPQQTTTPQQEFSHAGLPTYYPSPYQTHMEELGKLPRVLPVLFFFKVTKELCILG